MNEKKVHILSVRIDDDTYKTLENIAKKDDRNVSYLVRKLLEQFVKEQETKNIQKERKET